MAVGQPPIYPFFKRLALLAVFLAAACDGGDDQTARKPTAPSVVVATAFAKEIRKLSESVGKVEAIQDVNLIARVNGYLESKLVADGASVKAGDLIFTIEKEPYQAALAVARADLAKAQAQAALKAADLARDKDLYKKGHVSKAKYESTLAAKQKADAEVAGAKASLDQAELNIGYTDIKAPFDGRIGKTTYSVGEFVGPNASALARLTSMAPIYVRFSVSERRYLEVIFKHGIDPSDITQDEGRPDIHLILPTGERFSEIGEIVFIDDQVDPKTGTILVRARFINAGKVLVPGIFVTVVIESAEVKRKLLVPQAAVQRDQKGAFVLTVGDKQLVEQRYIEVGEAIETYYTVEEGLQEGERVIVQGLQKVRPGVPVNAVPAGQQVRG